MTTMLTTIKVLIPIVLLNRISCFAHTLQLKVSDGLKQAKQMNSLLKKFVMLRSQQLSLKNLKSKVDSPLFQKMRHIGTHS